LCKRFHPRQRTAVLHNQLSDVTAMLSNSRRVSVYLPQKLFLLSQNLAGVSLASRHKAKAED